MVLQNPKPLLPSRNSNVPKRPTRNTPARCTSTFTRWKRPPHPERAEVAADELGDLVPVAGHLVHMPAHIYLRVGRYHDAVTANELAATADEDYIAQCNAQGFYPAVYTRTTCISCGTRR